MEAINLHIPEKESNLFPSSPAAFAFHFHVYNFTKFQILTINVKRFVELQTTFICIF